MKFFELDIEHSYKGKFANRHRFKSGSRVYTVGASKKCDVRLLGDDVSEIHAYIEFNENIWSIIDANSKHGTWYNKKPITRHQLETDSAISIGGHILKLNPRTFERQIFSAIDSTTAKGSGNQFHQVVLKRNDQVVSTELLAANEPYIFCFSEKHQTLPAPRSGESKTSSFGEFTVLQRIVLMEDLKLSSQDLVKNLSDPELRVPLFSAILMVVLVVGFIFAIPQKPNEELTAIKPDNKYTRMIFDAKLMKKKKQQAQEMRKTIMAKGPVQPQQKNTITTPVKSKGATPKVVSKLKLDGLNSLLGKIAKRANVNGPTIKAFGQSAENRNTSGVTTVAAVGSLQGVATGTVGNGGETFKLGGVGTFGKAGTGRSVAGIGGLAAGAAGSGTVGILDEETEIEGGLEKEVIARVITGYLGEIRYCYERQLSADPDIYGKVQVKFTIDGNGSVAEQRVGASSLNSAMVEGCILRRLARWKFPKPKGGTHVLVTYPFMFKATN